MAEGAVGGEASSDVRWIIRAGVVGLVAPVAGCGQGRVVVVGVALRAGQGGVGAGERKRSVVVIEGGAGPRCGVVAEGAVGGEGG